MRAWLSQKGLEHELRDFFECRFSEAELLGLIGNHPVREFFSWASPSFRKLGVKRHDLDDDQLISLMINEPRLIRRPLIVIGGKLLRPISGVAGIISAIEEQLSL